MCRRALVSLAALVLVASVLVSSGASAKGPLTFKVRLIQEQTFRHPHPPDGKDGDTFSTTLRLFAVGRVLGFPGITVAAVNGHAFAAGAMLTCAHDIVVMREDRGYWCLPEVDLGLPLTPAMHAVVAAHVSEPTLRDALHSGRRFSGPEAKAAGIVSETAPEALVLERAIARASELAGKNRAVIRTHKQLMYGRALELCGLPPA